MANYKFYEGKERDRTHSFINPYTFVPINPKSKHVQPTSNSNLHSGVITCEIRLKTPLIIPDTYARYLDKYYKDHYHYPFMTIGGGEPLIPASSIRGPVRSVYETYTESCFGTIKRIVTSEGQEIGQTITARTNSPFNPCVVEFNDGVISLKKAKRYKYRKNEARKKYQNGYGQEVYFTEKNEVVQETYDHSVKGSILGYVAIGEEFGRKKFESIFVPTTQITLVKGVSNSTEKKAKTQEILRHAIDGLKETLAAYQNPSVNSSSRHGKYLRFEAKLNEIELSGNGVLPLWFSNQGEILHFSPACIGRFGYDSTLNEKIGAKNACISRESCCKACSLFGMIGKKGEEAGSGSKVRFTDARLKSGTPELDEYTLKELGTPRISYLPFYSRSSSNEIPLNGYDDSSTEIAGRKYYWHHIPNDYRSDIKNNRNGTFQVLKTGAKKTLSDDHAIEPLVFEFMIYFDALTAKEFNELIWVLCLGENKPDGTKCYKIGHAKPLGFGSIKIFVTGVLERQYKDGSYKLYNISFGKYTNKPESIKNTKWDRVLDFNALDNIENSGINVRYPRVHFVPSNGITDPKRLKDNVLASHQWYKKNYSLGGGSAAYVLPRISDENQSLPDVKTNSFKPDKDCRGNQGNH